MPPPKSIIIDPVNTCHLKCPYCPTGVKKIRYKKSVMTMTTFKTVIQQIPSLKIIYLFNWGEPFLNPDLHRMIEYAERKNIFVSVHSNLSLKLNDEALRKIINSGLDELIVSVDGASQETYSQYRIGGDFELVISNIMKLVEMKKQLKSEKPDITWKLIVNKYNENEIEKAEDMADRLGVSFHLGQIGLGDDLPDFDFDDAVDARKEKWLPLNSKYVREIYRGKYSLPLYENICGHLFCSPVVNPDGKVTPCCYATDEQNVFGDLLTESFDNIWNNHMYRSSRNLFVPFLKKISKVETICMRCNNYMNIRSALFHSLIKKER